MKTKDIKAFEKLINNLRSPGAMPDSSDPEFESGIDMGRENAADEIECLLAQLTESKTTK